MKRACGVHARPFFDVRHELEYKLHRVAMPPPSRLMSSPPSGGVQSQQRAHPTSTVRRTEPFVQQFRCIICSTPFLALEEAQDHFFVCKRRLPTSPTALMTPAPTPSAAPPSTSPRVPASLEGFRIGSDAVAPMPLPPIPGDPPPAAVHPFPYTDEGWSGTLPGPATAPPPS